MRQSTFCALVEQAMSPERLRPYRLTIENAETEVHGRYLWNVALSEALHPTMQAFEVALRNSLHAAATNLFGANWWFNSTLPNGRPLLRQQEFDRFNEVTSRLRDELNRVGRPMVASDVVAGLHLGFWNNLFVSHYERPGSLWPHLITVVFPHAPRGPHRSRRALFNRVKMLRDLRNRVSHFEPIWNQRNLQSLHSQLLETTAWLSPSMAAQARLLDRFPTIYAQGWRPFEAKLVTYLRTLPP